VKRSIQFIKHSGNTRKRLSLGPTCCRALYAVERSFAIDQHFQGSCIEQGDNFGRLARRNVSAVRSVGVIPRGDRNLLGQPTPAIAAPVGAQQSFTGPSTTLGDDGQEASIFLQGVRPGAIGGVWTGECKPPLRRRPAARVRDCDTTICLCHDHHRQSWPSMERPICPQIGRARRTAEP